MLLTQTHDPFQPAPGCCRNMQLQQIKQLTLLGRPLERDCFWLQSVSFTDVFPFNLQWGAPTVFVCRWLGHEYPCYSDHGAIVMLVLFWKSVMLATTWTSWAARLSEKQFDQGRQQQHGGGSGGQIVRLTAGRKFCHYEGTRGLLHIGGGESDFSGATARWLDSKNPHRHPPQARHAIKY